MALPETETTNGKNNDEINFPHSLPSFQWRREWAGGPRTNEEEYRAIVDAFVPSQACDSTTMIPYYCARAHT